MRPHSKFVFVKSETANTSFILQEHYGADIPFFPARYKTGEKRGLGYIYFRRTVDEKCRKRYEYTISVPGVYSTYTGVNFTPSYPTKTHGNNKHRGGDDAILMDFVDDKIIMYFFKGQAKNENALFEKWVSNALCMICEGETPVSA